MKIVATTKRGVMVEASKNEMALIMGFRSEYADGFKSDSLNIGREVEIDKIDKISKFVRTLDTDKLTKIKDNLQEVVNEIDKAVDTTQQLTLFAKLEEEEAND